MPTTPLQAFPYPALSDPANGPVALQQLAEATEKQVVIRCTSTTRPAAPEAGMLIYETDTGRMHVYSGSTWQRVLTGMLVDFGLAQGTSDVAGDITVAHSLGVTPIVVLANTQNAGFGATAYGYTATEFKLRFQLYASGDRRANQAVQADYLAVAWQ